jgi:hypothetical protein
MDKTDYAADGIVIKGPSFAVVATTAAKDICIKADDEVIFLLLSAPPPPHWRQIEGQRHAVEVL